MLYLLIIGIIIGGVFVAYIANLVMQNQTNFYEYKLHSEKQMQNVRVDYSIMKAQNEILQEVAIDSKVEKEKAYEMFFRVANIAAKNMEYPSQSMPKPLPYYSQNTEIENLNGVYTPNDTIESENKPIGESGVKMMSKTIARKGVSEYLISQDDNYKFSETETGIVLGIKGKRYVCSYPKEKGTTVKVSVLALYLGKCLLSSCDNNFLTKEQSTKHCCDKHKNENNNSK